MDFKVGDKVKIRPDSQYYDWNTASNPSEVEGYVTSVNIGASLIYKVAWPNDSTNHYSDFDLELVDRIEDLARAFEEDSLEEKSNIFVGNRETTLTIRIKDDTIILSESEAEQLLTELHNELRGA